MPQQRASQRTHACSVCDSRFSRLAHLHRHQLLHTDTPPELFRCHACDKSFKRKDVYQRHQRGVHGPSKTDSRTRRKKSCERCVRYKLKCSREIPCAACKDRNVSCKYDSAVIPAGQVGHSHVPSPHVRQNQQGQPPDRWSLLPSGEPLQHHRVLGSDNPRKSGIKSLDQPRYRPDTGIDSLLNAAELRQGPPLQHCEGSNHDLSGTSETPTHDVSSTTPPALEQLQASSLSNDGDQYNVPFAVEDNDDLGLLDFGFMFDGNTFQASKTDWLGATADYSDRQTLGSVHLPSESPYDLDFRQPRGEIAPGTASTPAVSVPTDGHSADVSAGKDGASDWPHALDQGGGVWPFDYTSNRGYRRIRLPPLRQVLEETVGQRPSIEKATLSDLIKILSAPRIPCVNDSPAPEALPVVNFLTKLIRIYFEEFHPVANVIHLPTWRVEDCPTALLAAMACLGATYSTAEGSSEVAVLLAEITQRSLLWMGQADTTNFKDPAFITAMCLHHTYSLGSGNRRLYELADAARGTMVTSLRSTGILSLEASEGETLSSDNLQQMTESELEVAWAQWRSSETLKRVAWMVFEFDCTVSMMTNKRGAFSISELPTRLPCADSLWEAQCASAKAWASMVFFSTESRRGLQTYTLMQQLTSQRSVTSTIPSWGKRLCAQTISRLLWDLKEMKDASAPIALGIPSIAAGYKSSNDTLLQSLNILNESLSSPINMSDIVNMNVTSLGIYYTDLINRTSAMDLIIFIFRNSGRERSPQLAAELTRAETHLCNTFAHDPVDTRRSVVSAANIITISRECTSTTPCEVMRLFNGYAYLLAFTCFFPFERLHTRGAAAKLDVLPWRRTAIDETGLKAWVERSGPASFLSVDDICDSKNFETLKQEGLRALDGLRTWGLARKFYRVLQSLT